MNKTRLEAFSDGVIAIIITIMVLEMRVPKGGNFADLLPLVPTFISYFMSFLFVGIYWGNHHHLLHVVKHVSSGIILANLNLLFWLSLVPFATGWMGENNFEAPAVASYSLLLIFCGLAYTILQHLIIKCSVLNEHMRKALDKQKRKGVVSVVAYALAIPAAFLNPIFSGGLFILVAVMWLVPDKNIERALNEK